MMVKIHIGVSVQMLDRLKIIQSESGLSLEEICREAICQDLFRRGLFDAKRIQRQRKKGWVKPLNTVNVTRPSKWGNPFKVGNGLTADGAVRLYRANLEAGLLSITVEDVRRDLKGQDLMCFCPLDQPCHADVLLEIANK